MIAVTLLDQSTAYVAPNTFVRLRPASTPGELGVGAVTVLDAASRMLLKDEPNALGAAFDAPLAVVKLTTPNDLPVYIATDKILSVTPPMSALHHPKAKAVLKLSAGLQQVRETIEEVVEAMHRSATTALEKTVESAAERQAIRDLGE